MLAQLTWMQITIAVAVALPASFVRGLSGFGLALMLVPVLALTVDPAEAVVTANALGVVLGLVSLRKARLEAEASVRLIATLALLLTPVGLALLTITPDALARVIIALVALGAFVTIIVPKPAKAAGSGRPLTAATGVCCGLLAGFAGMPGPPVVAYYLGRKVSPAQARASMFVIFLVTSIVACLAAVAMGIATLAVVWLTAILTPAVLLGNWLGALAFGKVDERIWRTFAGAIVAGAAIVALKNLL